MQKALETNTVILSLDLSKNNLTDAGACALAEQLSQTNIAPNLIELVVRDNCGIGEQGTAALEGLAATRKSLRVVLGTEEAEIPQQQETSTVNKKGMSDDAARNSAVVRKYFQVGNGDDDDDDDDDDSDGSSNSNNGNGVNRQNGQLAGDDDNAVDPEQLAIELWDQLMSAIDSTTPHIPSLSEPLRAIVDHIEMEMTNCMLPMLPDTTQEDLKPFSRTSLALLPILDQVLAVQPPPIPTTYSRQHPVSTVGSHRQAVVELIAQLLRAQCPVVIEQVRSVLPRCIDLAVNHPNCSAIQCSVLRAVQSLVSPACGHLMTWKDEGIVERLAVWAVGVVEKTREEGVPIGKRASNVGFALAVVELLQSTAVGAEDIVEMVNGPLDVKHEDRDDDSEEEDEAEKKKREKKKKRKEAEKKKKKAMEKQRQQQPQLLPEVEPWQQDLAIVLEKAVPNWKDHFLSSKKKDDDGASSSSSSPASSTAPLILAMLAEQRGDLGGPRPEKRFQFTESSFSGLNLSSLTGGGGDGGNGQQGITSQDLLMMLKGLQMASGGGGDLDDE